MDRLKELKEKGWKNLNAEERKEFKALTGDSQFSNVDNSGAFGGGGTGGREVDTITIKKSDLQDLVAHEVSKATQALQRGNVSGNREAGLNGYQPYVEPKQKVYTATIRKYRPNTDEDYCLITDWKHLRWDYNELSRKHDKDIYKVKLRAYNGEEKWVEMPLEEMNLVNEFETVSILEKSNNKKQRTHGFTYKKFVDNGGYTHSDVSTSERVPLIELKDDFTCKVQLENGDVLTIREDRLNG